MNYKRCIIWVPNFTSNTIWHPIPRYPVNRLCMSYLFSVNAICISFVSRTQCASAMSIQPSHRYPVQSLCIMYSYRVSPYDILWMPCTMHIVHLYSVCIFHHCLGILFIGFVEVIHILYNPKNIICISWTIPLPFSLYLHVP